MDEGSLQKLGLSLVGFPESRQRVRQQLNKDRFKAHYGINAKGLADFFNDIKDDIEIKSFLITMNWLKGYDTEHVLAGRWDFGEDYIRDTVRSSIKKMRTMFQVKVCQWKWQIVGIYLLVSYFFVAV